jgi:hypothetical protein
LRKNTFQGTVFRAVQGSDNRLLRHEPDRRSRQNLIRLLLQRVMSAFGTKQTFRNVSCLSAFGGKADIAYETARLAFWLEVFR